MSYKLSMPRRLKPTSYGDRTSLWFTKRSKTVIFSVRRSLRSTHAGNLCRKQVIGMVSYLNWELSATATVTSRGRTLLTSLESELRHGGGAILAFEYRSCSCNRTPPCIRGLVNTSCSKRRYSVGTKCRGSDYCQGCITRSRALSRCASTSGSWHRSVITRSVVRQCFRYGVGYAEFIPTFHMPNLQEVSLKVREKRTALYREHQ